MDERAMIDLSALPYHIILPIGFLVGLLLGLGYFRALRETTTLIVSNGNSLLGIALTLGRVGMLVALLLITVLVGGGAALLAALAGVLCAKALMLRRLRSESP